MSDLFAREDERRDALDAERDEAWRYKSCERKNRYDTRAEAEAVMADCETAGGAVWPATNANTAADGT